MVALLAGICVGVLVAIPPGPISVIILKQTLNHGARRGIIISLGTTLLDFVYCLIFLVATGSVFEKIAGFLEVHSVEVMIFQVLCVIALISYGVHSIRSTAPSSTLELDDSAPSLLPKAFTTHGPFLLGVGLSLMQPANPTFVPLMTYVSLLAHDNGFVQKNSIEYGVFAFGYAAGIVAWLYCIIRLSVQYRSALSVQFLRWLNRFVGLTLVGFGAYLGFRVMSLMKWAEMPRWLFAF
jgi:threonine/homoserine/homoserine lactone efflux protein